MSAAGCIHVQCPECDALVPIDLILKPAERDADTVIVGVRVELTTSIM